MAEYIEREAAELCVKEHYDDAIIIALNKLPAADVVPVRHGRWDDFKPDMPVRRKMCSSCGFIINPWLAQVFNFCPNCGAKMDGDEV